MILALDDEVSLEQAGGKGANLARLVRAGFAVPPGFVVSTEAYREYIAANNLGRWILETAREARADDPESLAAASAAIRARFTPTAVAPELAERIRVAYARLGSPPVAVRSSATTEDLPELSFAGQQDTLLNVVGDVALLEAVAHCWGSLWTARAIGYRARNDIAHEAAALAVVVQRMVPSDVSGVLFTANPLTGKRTETVIDATVGLGEALVSGRVEPDHFVVDDRAGKVLERHLGEKALAIRPRDGGGTVESREDAGKRLSLDDEDVIELARLGRRVEGLFGTPQDIEWARADGSFAVLQARPVTSLFPLPAAPDARGLRVWVSFGAFQGMLDPMTPLGQDVFRVALPRGFRSAGLPAPAFVVAGERMFIDVTALVRKPRLRAVLRRALGVIEPVTGQALEDALAQDGGRWASDPAVRLMATLRALPLASRALGNVVYNLLRPDRGRERIQRSVAGAVHAFEKRGAQTRSLRDRVGLLGDVFAWLPQFAVPRVAPGLITGLASMQVVRRLAAGLPDSDRRVLEMTRGLPHNVTTEMDLALWDVAQQSRADASGATRAFDAFLRRYGMRGVAEIDIGRPRWRDDPAPLVHVLDSYRRIDDPQQAPDAVFRRGAEAARLALESLIADVRRTPRGWLKARLLRTAARRMRALAGLRETPKFTIVRMLGVVREALVDSGRELVARQTLEAPDDIFFLHVDELESLSAGDGSDWRSLVRRRRATYSREMRRHRIPRVLLSDGRAFHGGGGPAEPAEGTITGTGVSPGVVEGAVHVVSDPTSARLAPGEILVCRGTDPAWTPLFLAAGGLVTEVGGMMTHGSVVAREYGIPAVVGVHGATTRLHTGERVRVDGSLGRITILDT